MKTELKKFLVLLQTGGNSYEVMIYEGATSKSIYPEYRKHGMAVEIRDYSRENQQFLCQLGESLKSKN